MPCDWTSAGDAPQCPWKALLQAQHWQANEKHVLLLTGAAAGRAVHGVASRLHWRGDGRCRHGPRPLGFAHSLRADRGQGHRRALYTHARPPPAIQQRNSARRLPGGGASSAAVELLSDMLENRAAAVQVLSLVLVAGWAADGR